MSETVSVELPTSLPYPIRITRVLADGEVQRGTALLEYAFTSDEARKELAKGGKGEWDMVGSWDSAIEGRLDRWEEWVKPGTRVERSKIALWLEQSCSHPVQLHGMCGVCGRDLTTDDYLTRGGPSKYAGSYEMSHDSLGVTVSTNEAKRLENVTKETLLSSKRLSLIVDLDQTIIHTTVDPTVGEWIEQGKKALEDVAKFHLPDDVPLGYTAPDRWYYTKPRPGVNQFLRRMNELYEMHVYTMGTRTYAEAICNVVDPDKTFFGGRIISRDENKSFSSKSLKRLFPTDQSMVVVIDDRADVWGEIPNLVKVVPYDFFIGVGDINKADSMAQTKLLDAQSEDRPLAKESEPLNNDDAELERVAKILAQIHSTFYRAYAQRVKDTIPMGCDVEVIIPDIKSRVLEGCTLVFSGVIPKHQAAETSGIFHAAEMFGARTMLDVGPGMTHCVTATVGTEKTYRASRMDAAVVWVEWFHKSIALWKRQDERAFSINGAESSTSPKQVENGIPEDGVDDGGLDNLLDGWDESADAELQAFMEGSSDYGEDTESVGSVPGSPSKKRVRYADEESLPLESFRDPPEDQDWAGDSDDRPAKRRLLLEAPTGDYVPEGNRFQWDGKMDENPTAEDDLFAQMLEDSLDSEIS
ncbi:hypothetical protein BD324DRAFT_611918 [Kockovaella imperatae]|uniref:RNA polymerase II subunit A C-terminal domain phosphatase n=1 Tax=Kockovaella imperatae TaxID=4999 RepID=A0A1Y1US01_9TREE|nr:hypothetical protein BD324DRAFT_611918 [Kockovaella imperatae]ORX40742.1 hypothetical protein BD324DRAFT_611918 [Kockovaella imperatae]